MTQKAFMYVGDHDQVTMHGGVKFPRNIPVLVDDESQKLLFGKLQGNSHFLALPDQERVTMAGDAKPPENPLGNLPLHPQPPAAQGQGGAATRHQGRR